MSDQRLRELERRWRETGSVEDEAAYLRERVRVGDLTQERLELAAYCGHEGATRATEVPRMELSALLEMVHESGELPTLICAASIMKQLVPLDQDLEPLSVGLRRLVEQSTNGEACDYKHLFSLCTKAQEARGATSISPDDMSDRDRSFIAGTLLAHELCCEYGGLLPLANPGKHVLQILFDHLLPGLPTGFQIEHYARAAVANWSICSSHDQKSGV